MTPPQMMQQQQQQGLRAFIVEGTPPDSEVTFFRRKDVLERFLKWGPLGMSLTFLLTLSLTVFLSIRAVGNPCYMPVCDISVYGGTPRGGASTVMFKAGFTLLVLEGLPVMWARFLQTSNRIAFRCFVAAMIALLIMAYVPYDASPVHFVAAAAAFVLLGIGQFVDTLYSSSDSSGSCSSVQCVRRGMVVIYLILFGIWFVEENQGNSLAVFEWLASLGPFLVFITWSIEMCAGPASGTPGQASECSHNNVA